MKTDNQSAKFLVKIISKRAYPKNFHTPSTEEIGNSCGGGGPQRPKNFKKCMKFNWNFQKGGGSYIKSLPWGTYVYFLELHNE